MRKFIKHEWTWENNTYTVGESLNNYPYHINNIYPVVWFEGRLYKAFIKPESRPRIDRVCLIDFYNSNKKPYWTTTDKVFQIIKQ